MCCNFRIFLSLSKGEVTKDDVIDAVKKPTAFKSDKFSTEPSRTCESSLISTHDHQCVTFDPMHKSLGTMLHLHLTFPVVSLGKCDVMISQWSLGVVAGEMFITVAMPMTFHSNGSFTSTITHVHIRLQECVSCTVDLIK